MAISVVPFSFSRAAQPEARGPSRRVLFSLPHLVSNSSVLQFADFLSSPSYIIVQSTTQSLEWHVWSSSSRNNCHAIDRLLSSGASVYDCTMGFYLVPYCQPSPPTRFLPIIAIGMCHFLPVHHFGLACLAGSKVNIQHLYPVMANGIRTCDPSGFNEVPCRFPSSTNTSRRPEDISAKTLWK